MIKYNLKCHLDHEFESWFSDSAEFDRLNKKKLLECIYCSSKKINKSIMAPMITNSKNKFEEFQINSKELENEKNKLKKLKRFVENNFEFVGKNFSKRVREIYYDKKNNKAIYGTTTPKERKELAEEGIEIFSIPWRNISKDN